MNAERDPELPVAQLAERVAELDTGLVDGREAGAASVLARRGELAADRRHAAVVEALAATRAELASTPAVPMPSGAPARWSALVDELHDDVAPEPAAVPVIRLPRRRAARAALGAAAALVVAATAVGVLGGGERPDASGVALVGTALSARDVRDVGELADPARRAACLTAVAPRIDPAAPLLGGRRVRYDGTPAVLLLLGTGRRGTFTVAVVDDSCRRLLVLRTVP